MNQYLKFFIFVFSCFSIALYGSIKCFQPCIFGRPYSKQDEEAQKEHKRIEQIIKKEKERLTKIQEEEMRKEREKRRKNHV